MQLSKGVEWACHAAALMAGLPAGQGLRAEALARYHEVPAAYMAKQLQALSKAGIVKSSRGARGGYWLAKAPIDISLWDITRAIEGDKRMFRCTEIRQNGPCPAKREACKAPCAIARSFYEAEMAFREALKDVALADIALQVVQVKSTEEMEKTLAWIAGEAVTF